MRQHALLCTLVVTAAMFVAPPACVADPADVPEEALTALRDGRYYRASRILESYIEETGDTAPATLLLAARAAAGWGDWSGIERLLARRSWLAAEGAAEGLWLLGWSRLERDESASAAATLRQYLEAAGSASERDRGIAYVRLGDALRESDDAAAALDAWDRAAALLPDIAGWIGYSAARTAAEVGDTTELRRRLDRLDADILRSRGWRLRVEALRTTDDLARAIAVAESAATTLDASADRARASVLAAEMHLETGDTTVAVRAYRRALDTAPTSGAALDAARTLVEITDIAVQDQLAIGRLFLRSGDYRDGARRIETWLAAGRGSAGERERVRLELAHALFRGGRYDDAGTHFARVAADPSGNAVGAEALFYTGRSRYRDGRTTQGRETFARVVETYPRSDYAARALYFMADLDQDDGEIERAKTRFRRAVENGSTIEEVGFAQMRLGGLAFLERDWAAAAREFDAYRNAWPTGRRWTQATYWSALAHLELGRDSIAHARFRDIRRVDPLSYYGGRAADHLGTDLLDIPLGPAPAVDETAGQAVERALVAFDLLRQLDRNDDAAIVLDRLRIRFLSRTATAYAFAEALARRGLGAMAVGIGWDLFASAGRWNERLLRIIYPLPFRPLIEHEAERAGIDPFLAAGLIRQESMFQPDARSGAGAIGLMQVLPETGRVLARTIDVPRFDTAMLRNPEINVILGVRYLADQLERFDERLPLVLGAYNAGPHRVARWSEFPEFDSDELFTERIPFTETREYVKIVQQNARIYRNLYGS